MFTKPIHWLLYGGIWVLMGLYYTYWDMVTYHAAFLDLLPLNLCQKGVWALAGLLIFRLARRSPITSLSRRSLPAWLINLGTGLVLALAGLALAWGIALAFEPSSHPAKAEGHLGVSLLQFTLAHLPSTLLLMWAMLGASHGFLLFQGMQVREVEKAQLEASLALARNQTLLAQFQPHFLFNALNSIASLIHSDPDVADRMVARLADLLRFNLDLEAGQEISLERELALVDAYLAIEKVRFQDRLTVTTAVAPDLARARVPKFLLLPLVENALKHGLAPLARPGRILIRATREGSWLAVEIQDNGTGFQGLREGIGLRNIRARLELLYHGDHHLEIFSVPDKGTRVVVRIPLH